MLLIATKHSKNTEEWDDPLTTGRSGCIEEAQVFLSKRGGNALPHKSFTVVLIAQHCRRCTVVVRRVKDILQTFTRGVDYPQIKLPGRYRHQNRGSGATLIAMVTKDICEIF